MGGGAADHNSRVKRWSNSWPHDNMQVAFRGAAITDVHPARLLEPGPDWVTQPAGSAMKQRCNHKLQAATQLEVLMKLLSHC